MRKRVGWLVIVAYLVTLLGIGGVAAPAQAGPASCLVVLGNNVAGAPSSYDITFVPSRDLPAGSWMQWDYGLIGVPSQLTDADLDMTIGGALYTSPWIFPMPWRMSLKWQAPVTLPQDQPVVFHFKNNGNPNPVINPTQASNWGFTLFGDANSPDLVGVGCNFLIVPAAPDPTKTTVVASHTYAEAGFGLTITVTDRDALGNAVATPNVYTLSAPGSSSVIQAPTTDPTGAQVFNVTDTTAETVTYQVYNTTLGQPLTQTATVQFVAGPVDLFHSAVTVSPTQVPADGVSTATIKVVVSDAYHNPIPDVTVAVSPIAGHPTVSGAVQSDANGVATFTVVDTRVETVTLQVSEQSTGMTRPIASYPQIMFTAGAFSRLLLLLPGETHAPGTLIGKAGTLQGQQAGQWVPVTVLAVDAYGNQVSSVTDTVSFTSTDPGAQFPAPGALAGGSGSFKLYFATPGSQTVTVSDTTDGTKQPGSSGPLMVTTGPVNHFAVTSSVLSAYAGDAISIAVAVQDGMGNPITGYTGPVQLFTGDGAAILPAAYKFTAADNGQHTFRVTLTTVGTWSITAQDQDQAWVNGVSAPVTITQGPLRPPTQTPVSTVSITGPQRVTAGERGTFTAQVTGGSGGPVTWTASDGVISGGVWQAPTRVGTYSVTATVGEATGTVWVQVDPGPVAALSLWPQGNLQVQAGEAVSLQLSGRDAYGNDIRQGTWRVDGVGAVDNQGAFRSTQAGIATVTAEAGERLVASGLITVRPGPAKSLTLQGPASLLVGDAAFYALEARDLYGNAAVMDSASVTWATVPAGMISAYGRLAAIAPGVVTVRATVGGVTGELQVTVQAPGGGTPGGTGDPAPGDGGGGAGGGATGPPTPAGTTALGSIRTEGLQIVPSEAVPPVGVTVVTSPVVIGGTGEQQVSFQVVPSVYGPNLLAYYWDETLVAWIPVPTQLAGEFLQARVPAGKPVALLAATVRQPPDTRIHWANAYLLKAQALGLMGGFPDGTFRPDGAVTRYQVARVLAGVMGLQPSVDPALLERLPDAAQMPEWAKPSVAVVVAAGLMTSEGDGFHGDAVVTRAQLATLVGRALGDIGPVENPVFTDRGSIPEWARTGAARAVATGILGGFPDGSFRPGDGVTRGQLARAMTALADWLATRRK